MVLLDEFRLAVQWVTATSVRPNEREGHFRCRPFLYTSRIYQLYKKLKLNQTLLCTEKIAWRGSYLVTEGPSNRRFPTCNRSSCFVLKRKTLKARCSRFSFSIFSIKWPADHRTKLVTWRLSDLAELFSSRKNVRDSQLYLESWPVTLSFSSTSMHLHSTIVQAHIHYFAIDWHKKVQLLLTQSYRKWIIVRLPIIP